MPTIQLPTNMTFSSDVTSHCRNTSITRLRKVPGYYNGLQEVSDEDIHGLKWHERVILTVVAYDRTEGKVIVRNPNGFEWLTDAAKIVFCNKYGNP